MMFHSRMRPCRKPSNIDGMTDAYSFSKVFTTFLCTHGRGFPLRRFSLPAYGFLIFIIVYLQSDKKDSDIKGKPLRLLIFRGSVTASPFSKVWLIYHKMFGEKEAINQK